MKYRTDEDCTNRLTIYFGLCSNVERYHLAGKQYHACVYADDYLEGCAKKEVNKYSGQIRYIPNKPEYDYLNVVGYKHKK